MPLSVSSDPHASVKKQGISLNSLSMIVDLICD